MWFAVFATFVVTAIATLTGLLLHFTVLPIGMMLYFTVAHVLALLVAVSVIFVLFTITCSRGGKADSTRGAVDVLIGSCYT